MTEQSILEIRNLKKTYDHDLFKKSQVILNNLSLKFPTGKCTALMGHNGAGKTTTIRTIFGLIKPDHGEVLFKGKPLSLADKKLIGYMPETNKLPLNLTCEEVLRNQLRIFNPAEILRKDYNTTIENSLREVELWAHRKKKVGALSKGMGRRLSWAQATIHRPELVILDEPMSGLDPLGHRLMSDWITQLRKEKVSIILCTHELWSIQELCDEIHIMRKGQLVFSTLDESMKKEMDDRLTYKLQISGTQLDHIKEIQKKHLLNEPLAIREFGRKLELEFSSYPEAAKWLQVCTQSGLVIVFFSRESNLDSKNLLQFFNGDTST